MSTQHLIVNFGGPRSIDEIGPFLQALLTDRDVIRANLPGFIHNYLFSRVAKKRVAKVAPEYARMGGRSPIYFDTEEIARLAGEKLGAEVVTFHRYLPSTHSEFMQKMHACSADNIVVFPLFPQFSYATTGSIARFFKLNLKREVVDRMRWIAAYPSHFAYLRSFKKIIREFLQQNSLNERDSVFLFSAHGLPQSFVDQGDPYQKHCELSFEKIKDDFPDALSYLVFQSQFGRAEWIKPSTLQFCNEITSKAKGRKNVIFVPLSFTSDHIETLVEVEHQYLPIVRAQGLNAFRCPALNCRSDWIDAIVEIMQDGLETDNNRLIRQNRFLPRPATVELF